MRRASRHITLLLMGSSISLLGCDKAAQSTTQSTTRTSGGHSSSHSYGHSGWGFWTSGGGHSSSSGSHVSSSARGGFGSHGFSGG